MTADVEARRPRDGLPAWPSSRSDARRGFGAGELSVNGVKTAVDDRVGRDRLLHHRFVLVRRGETRDGAGRRRSHA